MDPDTIELETMSKMFEYERQCRLVDDVDIEQLRVLAKSYLKLYLKQQEVINSFSSLDFGFS